MSVSNPTIDAGVLSKEIVRDLLAAELQNYADANGLDPKADEREPGDAPFVVTSFPTGSTVFYPHVVVSEQGVSLDTMDGSETMWNGRFSAGLQIEANTDTEKFRLKDGVRGWVVSGVGSDEFKSAGFADVSIDSTEETTWDTESQTTGKLVTISGLIHVV